MKKHMTPLNIELALELYVADSNLSKFLEMAMLPWLVDAQTPNNLEP